MAAWYARQIAGVDYRAITVRGRRCDPRGGWWDFSGGGVPIEALERVEGPSDAVLDYTWALPRGESSFVTVVIPELFQRRSLTAAVLRRRTSFFLKLRLLAEPGVVIADVPLIADSNQPQPERAVARVLVSGVQAASLRAVNYARSLGLPDTKAVFFAFDAEEARGVRQDWERAGIELPLDVLEAPFRDLGDPCSPICAG